MKSQNIERDGLFFVAVSVFAWGLTGIFVRLLPGLSALLLTGIRFLVAFFATLPIVLLKREKRELLLSAVRRPAAWLLGAALVANYLLAVAAYQYASVGEVALFLGTAPVFVLIARAIRGKAVERYERNGALVAIAGMVLVLAPNLSVGNDLSGRRILGIAFAMAAAAASAHYTGMSRALRNKEGDQADATVLTLLAFAVGAVVPLSAAALFQPLSPSVVTNPHTAAILVGFSIFCTTLPTITYAIAAQKLPATISTTAQLMIPVIATIAAALVLKDMPSIWLIPGGLLVLLGIRHMFGQAVPKEAALDRDVAPEFAAGD